MLAGVNSRGVAPAWNERSSAVNFDCQMLVYKGLHQIAPIMREQAIRN